MFTHLLHKLTISIPIIVLLASIAVILSVNPNLCANLGTKNGEIRIAHESKVEKYLKPSQHQISKSSYGSGVLYLGEEVDKIQINYNVPIKDNIQESDVMTIIK